MSANSRPFNESLLHGFHARLAQFNAERLAPALPDDGWPAELAGESALRIEEGDFVEGERAAVSERGASAPTAPRAFMRWYEDLRQSGPGQGDALFPWLARHATRAQMKWFLTQEAAGEAGFEDLLALTQMKLPTGPKLEMAANYWDEMGRGHPRGMHGPMLQDVVTVLGLKPGVESTVWQSLALSNLMVALAANRRYAYQSVGALGAIEMTAPGRVSLVNEGLKRLGVPIAGRKYFQLHAGLDIAHSKDWNEHVILPLAKADPRFATAIAEGALMRLAAGERCFSYYRAHFGI